EVGFEPISPTWRIWRKIGPASDIPVGFPKRLDRMRHSSAVAASAHRAALAHDEIPSVLIDEQFHVLRVYGDTRGILRVPPGQPSSSLLELAQPALIRDLRRAGTEALASGEVVTIDGLPADDSDPIGMSLRITPLQTAGPDGAKRLLVSFQH